VSDLREGVTPERTSPPTVPRTFEDLYEAYAVELQRWLHWLRLSPQDAEDAAQDVWLVVSANLERIPTGQAEARKELVRIATSIARTMRRRAIRNAERHVPVFPEKLRGRLSHVEQLDNLDELMDAIDQLDERLREAFVASKVLGFSYLEIAAMKGVTERTICNRVWSACAQIRKKLGQPDERKDKRGVVIAPAEIEIAPETRAAMCALWSIEGRMPQFGGPKDPPPRPPIPWFANASPVVSQAARGVTLKVNQAILLLLLLLTSAGTVALIWFWEPTKVDSARSGLRVPQTPVGEINDVVAYPAPFPAAPSARASARAFAPKATPKTRQTLDDDALNELDGPGLTRSGSGSE